MTALSVHVSTVQEQYSSPQASCLPGYPLAGSGFEGADDKIALEALTMLNYTLFTTVEDGRAYEMHLYPT